MPLPRYPHASTACLKYAAYHPALRERGHNTYSQFGEDGLIEAALEVIGTTNRWCFEFGAADGIYFSNTRKLVDEGWKAAWIEENEDEFGKLVEQKPPGVHVRHATVTPENVDCILTDLGVPTQPDVGVIDVDGIDLLIWNGMRLVAPRLLLIEFAIQEDQTLCDGQPAPLLPTWNYGDRRGYRVVAGTKCNLLFVQKELIDDQWCDYMYDCGSPA